MGAGLEIPNLLVAVAIAYLLGSIPLADRISKRRGVDIFSIGTGLAGASNVRRNVGNLPAAVVVLGDAAKGMVAILIAKQLVGIEGPLLFVPAIATVIGHWNSIFTRFRGGDGLVVLGGISLMVFSAPVGYVIAFLGVTIGVVVALGGQKMPYTSLLCIISGYGAVIALTRFWNPDEMNTAIAMGTLAIVVFGHAVFGHARRRRGDSDCELAGDGQAINNHDGLI